MSEATIFLIDLALLAGAGVLALAAGSSAGGSLASGLYALVTGVLLVFVPYLAWEVARTDNAFLGLSLIGVLTAALGAVLAVRALVRRGAGRSRGAALTAAGVAAAAAVVALALLLARGPDAWRTGSGQFGLDVAAVDVALGVATYFAADRLGRRVSRRTV
jgi:hypothetical protein